VSSLDPELLRTLANADAQSPPPAGVDWSPAGLARAHARSVRRRAATWFVIAAAALLVVTTWPRPALTASIAGDADAGVRAELRALRADVQRLQAWVATRIDAPEVHLAAAARDRRVRTELRHQLAAAGADAALRFPHSSTENR
jgi:hypothetical protein